MFAEARENNLGLKALDERWARWHTCSLCKQRYHGFVNCALGWACWKTYLGRPEENRDRIDAMTGLGNGLSEARQYEDALSVKEAMLSSLQRLNASEDIILRTKMNVAITYTILHRDKSAIKLHREAYVGFKRLHGVSHQCTINAAQNLVNALGKSGDFAAAKALLREQIPYMRQLGPDSSRTLQLRLLLAMCLNEDNNATRGDIEESVTILEDVDRRARRVLGGNHPLAAQVHGALERSRRRLANFKPK